MSDDDQEQQLSASKFSWRVALHGIRIVLRDLYRHRKQPYTEQEEQRLAATLRMAGVRDERPLRLILAIIRVVRLEQANDEEYHRLDRYLVGGCGIVMLVLFQVLAALGMPDVPIMLSWLCLAIGLPCIGASFFLSFVREQVHAPYGRLHTSLSFLAGAGTICALIAFMWHFAVWLGVVLTINVTLLIIMCFLQMSLVRLRKHFKRTRAWDEWPERVHP